MDTDTGNKSGNLCGGCTAALIRDRMPIRVMERRNCKIRNNILANGDLTPQTSKLLLSLLGCSVFFNLYIDDIAEKNYSTPLH